MERILIVIAGLLAPLLAPSLLTSKRNRLLKRIRAYNDLAGALEPHDPGAAVALRATTAALVEQLVPLEHTALARRFDPSGVFALGVMLIPAGVGSYYALTREGWWTWPVLAVSAIWTVIVISVGWDAIWSPREHEDEAEVGPGGEPNA